MVAIHPQRFYLANLLPYNKKIIQIKLVFIFPNSCLIFLMFSPNSLKSFQTLRRTQPELLKMTKRINVTYNMGMLTFFIRGMNIYDRSYK